LSMIKQRDSIRTAGENEAAGRHARPPARIRVVVCFYPKKIRLSGEKSTQTAKKNEKNTFDA